VDTLERLVRAHFEAQAPALADPQVRALVARIRQQHPA
jgi:hypothetical protein